MPLAAGNKLDAYEILDLLGSGGMGEVYRARDPGLQRDVAIKVLPAFFSLDPERLRRFQQEAQAAAAINHPNILAVYHLGVFGGLPYLVSELLHGETLRARLQHGPLPLRKAIDYVVQIANGLAAAQAEGIIHRDLKPENLFITRNDRIKILDFGIAKLVQNSKEATATSATVTHSTEPGLILGTMGYMAPEQARGLAVDHRADIFALGTILYEMLAGKQAFARATSADTLSATLTEDPPPLSVVAPSTPPGLSRVVQRCLEKSPELRFQTASDLAFALETLTSPGAIPTAAAVTPAPSRKRSLWLAAAAAVLAIGSGIYFLLAAQGNSVPLRIAEYIPVTHDGHAGQVVGTDGSRIYLQPDLGRPIGQVSTTGGEIEPMPVPVPKPFLQSVSPDGSRFLVASYEHGLLPTQPLWSVSILGGSLRYLADVTEGIWSPDGASVLYAEPNGDIDQIQSDGTGAHKLASIGGDVDSLAWSPDASRIRFVKNHLLWEMSPTGANLRQVLPGWRVPHTQCCGTWSSDGRLFVFLSGPGPQIWAIDEHRSLFHTAAGTPVQLTSGPIRWGTPVPGKDGKSIFATGSTLRGELVRLDLSTKQLQPFLAGISAESVTFSRDGRSVAYVSYPEGILWKANQDGSERIQLSAPPVYPHLLSWSPDGSQILFIDSTANGKPKIWAVSSRGGNAQRLLGADAGAETDPTFSPDGQGIVFSTSEEAGRNDSSTLRILNQTTRQVTEVPGSKGMYSPRWSPDGKHIAAESFDSSSLHLFDVQTRQWTERYKGELAFPVWSRDSSCLYFMTYRSDPGVFRLRLAGGKPERIVDLANVHTTGYYGLWLGLDPTDAPLLLRDTGTTDVYSLAFTGK